MPSLLSTLKFNFAWSIILFLWFLPKIFHYEGFKASTIVVILAAIYATTSFIALQLRRWCIVICLLIPILALIRWLPMVIINFWMYFNDDALYLNSPGTILIVIFKCMKYVAIPLFLLISYLCNARQLLGILKPR